MLIVTGMHRSGTSMIANLLYEMGADFGDESQLLEADQWNVRGYYENREVFILNDGILLGDYAPSRTFWTTPPEERSILLRLTMTFARMRYLLTMWNTDSIARRASKKHGQIAALAAEFDSMVVKDPRMSLLVGEWARLANVGCVLYCYRHPYEVASSLKKRGKSPLWLGYRLWIFHVSEFFRKVEGLPLVIVNYNNFFRETRDEEMKRLYAFLGMPYQETAAKQLLSSVMDARLKKNIYDESQPLPQTVESLYAHVNDYHAIYSEPKRFTPT